MRTWTVAIGAALLLLPAVASACLDLQDTLDLDAALTLAGTPRDVAIPPPGDVAYVVTSTSARLYAVDISVPSQPAVVGVTPISTVSNNPRVLVAGNTAYVVLGGRLQIFDVTTPSSIQPLATFDSGGFGQDACLGDGTVYITGPGMNCTEVDVSDPSAPLVSALIPTSSNCYAAHYADGLLFLGLYGTSPGLEIVDPAGEPDPTLLASLTMPASVRDLNLMGSALLAACGDQGLAVVDVSTPSAPVQTAAVATSTTCYRVDVEGDLAVLTGASGSEDFTFVDLSLPSTPTVYGVYSTARLYTDPWYCTGVLAGDAFIFSSQETLGVLDMAGLSWPALIGSTPQQVRVERFVRCQGEVYSCGTGDAVHRTDLGDPAHPIVTTLVDLQIEFGGIMDICAGDDVLYVLTNYELFDFHSLTLHVIDPATGDELSRISHDGIGPPNQLLRIGDRLYLHGITGFWIYDISDPLAPTRVSTSGLPGQDTYAYTGSGHHLYLGRLNGIAIVDATDPLAPVETHLIALAHPVRAITRKDSFIYAVEEDYGLRIYNASSPGTLLPVSALPLPATGDAITVDGGVAYCSTRFGLLAVDVTHPDAPVYRGLLPAQGGAGPALLVDEDLLLVAGGNSSPLITVEPQCADLTAVPDALPAGAAILRAPYPNPFNPTLTIPFALAEPADVSVEIFSVDGRRLAALDVGHREAGEGSVTWLATDDAGSALPSGVYLLRLRAGHTLTSRRVTLLR